MHSNLGTHTMRTLQDMKACISFICDKHYFKFALMTSPNALTPSMILSSGIQE